MHNNIILLGSTGSIGTQTLDIVERLKLKVLALSAKSNVELLEYQVRKYCPEYVCIADKSRYSRLKHNLKDTSVKILCGDEGICEVASLPKGEMVINSIIGMSGLKPTLAAIDSGKRLGLANKESLVAAGKFIMNRLKFDDQLIPIDSEHSAIFQSLMGNDKLNVKKILLTASGGPFFGKCRNQLENVTIDQALNHPNWSMGKKITIDSSTLMNKGLELIEAVHLFNVNPNDVEVLIHRESIIHSMVQYVDKSIIAQLSSPDMRMPIQFAITYPDRVEYSRNSLNFFEIQKLSFYEPDYETFRSLNLAKNAIIKGNIYPCILNAANEEAVELFLLGKIKFTEIDLLVEKAIDKFNPIDKFNLNDIFNIDTQTRNIVKEMVKS